MKDSKKQIIVGLVIFLILTIAISCWYISLNYLEEYNFKKITEIVTRIGLIAAIIPSLTISLIYYFILKIRNKLFLLFLIIISVFFLIFQIYWIATNLFFYEINDHSKSFLTSLLDSFR